jgi:hypothetical protein
MKGLRSSSTLTIRLLTQRRDEILGELRAVAPDLVTKLEQTLEALTEQRLERSEYEGLTRLEAIRKYLLKVGRPAELREISDAVAAPASRFHGRSIWDGGKREVEQGRLFNVADAGKGEVWVLTLPEWSDRVSAGGGLNRLLSMPHAVANDNQPDREGQSSANDRADRAVVSDHVAGKIGEAQQGDNVSGKAESKESVVHVVERVSKPGKEQSDHSQDWRSGREMGQGKAGQHSAGKGAHGSSDRPVGGVT